MISRVDEEGEQSYAYDRRGNLTAVSRGEEQLKALTFDAANRMRSAYEIKDGTGKRAEYTYNAFGNRIGQEIYGFEADNGIPETAVQKPQNPEQQIYYTLDLTRQYHNLLISENKAEQKEQTFYWDGNVAAMEEDERDSYYLQDDLGSPMQLVDEEGEIRETYGFDEFGLDLGNLPERQMQPFGYTGYQMEAAGGLYFAQARRYDAENGRFISEDKIPGFSSAPFTLNRYNYCWNQPINYIDRNGEWPEWIDTSEEGAREKIEENKENIIRAAEEAGVDPALVALMIYTEQVHNYNIIDTLSDGICGFYGVDTSVGIGQVRISTAKEIEEMGYMPLTSNTEGGWNLPFLGFVHGTEQMAREQRLEDDYINIRYVAAYVALIEDTWKEEFPDIYNRPDIVWTLYNVGYDVNTPHSDPQPGDYGEFAAENYDLMKCLLED